MRAQTIRWGNRDRSRLTPKGTSASHRFGCIVRSLVDGEQRTLSDSIRVPALLEVQVENRITGWQTQRMLMHPIMPRGQALKERL